MAGKKALKRAITFKSSTEESSSSDEEITTEKLLELKKRLKKEMKAQKKVKTSVRKKMKRPDGTVATVTERKYDISSDEEAKPAKNVEKGSELNSDDVTCMKLKKHHLPCDTLFEILGGQWVCNAKDAPWVKVTMKALILKKDVEYSTEEFLIARVSEYQESQLCQHPLLTQKPLRAKKWVSMTKSCFSW